MGKNLILYGEDYSTSATHILTPINMTLSVAAGGFGYLLNYAGANITKRFAILETGYKPFLVPSGYKCIVSGLKGSDGTKNPLRIDYVAYTTNDALSIYTASTSDSNPNASYSGSNKDSTKYFPFNNLVYKKQSTIVITNETANNLYFGLAARGNTDAVLSPADYPISILLMPI